MKRVPLNVPDESPGPGPSQKFDRQWLLGWAEAHEGVSPLARAVLGLLRECGACPYRVPAVATLPPDRGCSTGSEPELLVLADDGCPNLEGL